MHKRLSWLDDAKCIGIVCVILGHIIGFWNEDSTMGTKFIQGIIVSFNMPLFFVLSGYTFSLDKKWENSRYTLEYAIKCTKRLLVPAVVTGGILWTFRMAPDILNTFWFLNILWRILLVYAVVICLVRKLTSKHIIAFVGGQILFIVICILLGNRTSEFCWYFLVGVYAKQLHIMERSNIIFVVLAFLLGALILPVIIRHNFYDEGFQYLMTNNLYGIWALRILVGMLFSLGLMSVIKSLSKKYSLFSKIGAMTLGIYIVHSIYVVFIGKQLLGLFIKTGSNLVDWSLICFAVFFVLMLTVLTIILIRKSKYLKMIFLGEF